MDALEEIFISPTIDSINADEFRIKIILSVVLGLLLIVGLFFRARSDSKVQEHPSSNKWRLVIGGLLAVFAIASLLLMVDVYKDTPQLPIQGKPLYSLSQVHSTYTYDPDKTQKEFDELIDYELILHPEWMKEGRNGIKFRDLEKIGVVFSNRKYIEAFGQEAFDSKTRAERQFEYRNEIVQQIIELRFSEDSRFNKINALTMQEKLRIVDNPEYLSESEVMNANILVAYAKYGRIGTGLLLSFSFLLLAWAFYCFFFKPSPVSLKKKRTKVASYFFLVFAYSFCSLYINEKPLEWKYVSGAVIMGLMCLAVYALLLSKSSSQLKEPTTER